MSPANCCSVVSPSRNSCRPCRACRCVEGARPSNYLRETCSAPHARISGQGMRKQTVRPTSARSDRSEAACAERQ